MRLPRQYDRLHVRDRCQREPVIYKLALRMPYRLFGQHPRMDRAARFQRSSAHLLNARSSIVCKALSQPPRALLGGADASANRVH